MTAVTWIDGVLHQAAVPVGDPGFTTGLGVFETLPAVDGQPLHLTAHLDRLGDGAHRLGLPAPDHDRVQAGLRAVIDACGARLQRLRITLTVHLVLTAVPAEPWHGTMAVRLSPWALNERSPLAGTKCTSYAQQVLALREAQARGADEALLTDTRGRLAEGTFTNVFLVDAGVVHTPALETGCLPGVMRGLVLDWCLDQGIETEEGLYPPQRLDTADEIFLTNSMRGVVPARLLDVPSLPAPGPVTARLLTCPDLRPGR